MWHDYLDVRRKIGNSISRLGASMSFEIEVENAKRPSSQFSAVSCSMI
jgi:hypothetical protein